MRCYSPLLLQVLALGPPQPVQVEVLMGEQQRRVRWAWLRVRLRLQPLASLLLLPPQQVPKWLLPARWLPKSQLLLP